MSQEYLSNVELYYSNDIADPYVQMSEEESQHISKVMRHSAGEEVFVTDGKGSIHKTSIIEACSTTVTLRIVGTRMYENQFENITFCIPRLKSNDRFEFALEKCIELGITNFV
ncbi:MAG: RNA methyltransferase PUA domain-containing protein, partial [Bacteroidota bacterium]